MKLKNMLTVGTIGLASLIPRSELEAQRNRRQNYLTQTSSTSTLGYNRVVQSKNFSQVELAEGCDRSGVGRIQRTERWKPIIRAVEGRYEIPKNTLYAIVMQESCGDPLQPNSSGDGGIGLVHIQPGTARWLGLDTYGNSRALGRDHNHGKQLRRVIKNCKEDVNCVLKYDDRAHPIKNLDAIGRYLAHYKKTKGGWGNAVRMINPGQRNYISIINSWRRTIPKNMQEASNDFNRRNKGKVIEGKQLTFNLYIRTFNEMNKNYGLEAYKKGK